MSELIIKNQDLRLPPLLNNPIQNEPIHIPITQVIAPRTAWYSYKEPKKAQNIPKPMVIIKRQI